MTTCSAVLEQGQITLETNDNVQAIMTQDGIKFETNDNVSAELTQGAVILKRDAFLGLGNVQAELRNGEMELRCGSIVSALLTNSEIKLNVGSGIQIRMTSSQIRIDAAGSAMVMNSSGIGMDGSRIDLNSGST